MGGVVSFGEGLVKKGIDAGKGALHTVEGAGKSALHTVEGAGKSALHTVEGAGKSALHTVEGAGKTVVNTVEKGVDKGGQALSSAAHGLYDLGKSGLSDVQGFVDHTILGKDTPQEWKHDQSVARQAAAAPGETAHGQAPSANLQHEISGIRDDQTRIRSIANYYQAQDNEMRDKLGVNGKAGNPSAMTWDGWAHQAANLVGDVHKGDGFAGLMGRLTGANGDLAQGNKKVFNDIAPATDSFLKKVDGWKNGQGQFDEGKFKQWVASEPKNVKSDPRFVQGFEDYAKARFATSGADKDAYVTAGNVRLAQHEQRLLQPNIAEAMHGGLAGDVVRDVAGIGIPGMGGVAGDLEKWAAGRISTDAIPCPTLPGGQQACVTSDVHKGLPSALNGASPQARDTLDAAIRDSGMQPGQTQGTGATDYSDYNQRIKVLTGLISAYSVQS